MMLVDNIQNFIISYPILVIPIALILGYLLYRFTRYILARGMYKLALRTETVYDDLIVDNLQPFRVAWLVPLLIIYFLADTVLVRVPIVKEIASFFIIIVLIDFSLALLNGINDIYKHRPRYTGTSVSAYIDILKVLIILSAIIFTVWIFADVPPLVLLGSIGAWLAVLLLIFRDTILSFLASIQISTQELIKDGDVINVPSYNAHGFVVDMNLNSIKIQNFDNTLSVIPTYKIVDVAYINERVMWESGGRRMSPSIIIDINSIKFCDIPLLEDLSKYDMLSEYINEKITQIQDFRTEVPEAVDFPLDGPQITNIELFMKYIELYLNNRKDIHQRRLPYVLRAQEPTSRGMPIQIFVFTKTVVWPEFEAIQTEILIHLLAALPSFGLRVYQEASGTWINQTGSGQIANPD
jgi:miniconductance mechanosensitive channel